MAQQTAVEYFDEQIQERIIAQDVVARKMIIEISIEDYINIKKQAKQKEREQITEHSIGFQIYLNDKGLITDHDWDLILKSWQNNI